MKFALMAQTMNQLVNMIKFTYFNCEGSRSNSILYISDKVIKDKNNIMPLIEKGIVEDCFIYRDINYSNNKFVSKINTLKLLSDKHAFRKMLIEKETGNEFDVVVVPSVSLESQIFWVEFSHKKLYIVEDGLGSVTGDIVHDGMKNLRRFAYRLQYGDLHLDKLYMNKLIFNNSTSNTEFCELPGDNNDPEFLSLLEDIFKNKNKGTTYQKGDTIYLQQPVTLWDSSYLEIENKILETANLNCRRLIIRCHPLTINNPRIKGLEYDNENSSWELLCPKILDNNSILMGVFSTAQFSPKQLYDLEPYMIFLYNIITPTNIDFSEMTDMIDKLKQSYQHPEKIIVPASLDELQEDLLYLNKNTVL